MIRRSITGLIGYIGRTPVLWISRRQGAITTSTYLTKFMALHIVIEEAISLRYMLLCIGVPIPNDISSPTSIFGDNLSVIQNASNTHSCLLKKHGTLSFDFVCEGIAAGIIYPFWLKGIYNQRDILTKQIAAK